MRFERNAPGGDSGNVRTTVVTSLDFGLTEPAALRIVLRRWSSLASGGRVTTFP